MRTRPYCPDCKRAYADIRAHYQTQKHFRNVMTSDVDLSECSICMERREEFVQCTQCIYTWCTGCNQSMERCPYCRLEVLENDPTSRRLRRLFHQMDRWRTRHVDDLSNLPPLMVRMSWEEVSRLTVMLMQQR